MKELNYLSVKIFQNTELQYRSVCSQKGKDLEETELQIELSSLLHNIFPASQQMRKKYAAFQFHNLPQ